MIAPINNLLRDTSTGRWIVLLCFVIFPTHLLAQKDSLFFSQAFDTQRWYRIYLPSDYDVDTSKRYPAIYYFHGWGGRYKWDNYNLGDDPYYPGNGRTEPPFVMEWRDYALSHDVIIISWDGYEPNLAPGLSHREGIDYGSCDPYDYPRAHDNPVVHWGWDYTRYFRDLVAHIDSSYRTIADRDHRGITGLSMGGLTALYVSGQNKDLIGSVSAFCPADNIPRYGPKGHLSVFPVLEMYRSLKGLPMRLSANDGDWLLANDIQMKRIFQGSGFAPFEFHMADFPDHWAADIDLQLDFHLEEFTKKHERQVDWNHICPSFKSFDQWGYEFSVERSSPALTILENVSRDHMKVYSRTFIPDGPIVLDETINIITDSLYAPLSTFNLLVYNMTNKDVNRQQINSSSEGRLEFNLQGGGSIVGIHEENDDPAPDLRVVDVRNMDYIYFEVGRDYSLDLRLINIGNGDGQNIRIKALSNHPYIGFTDDEISIPTLLSGKHFRMDSVFRFSFNQYNEDYLSGNIRLEIKVNNVIVDTQELVFFTTPESPYADKDNVIVLDGRTQNNVPFFIQQNNRVEYLPIKGGYGNGNGIPEPGEEVLIYIRLEQGLAPKDKNTFHKTFLIDNKQDPYVICRSLKYDERIGQAGATSIVSYVYFSDTMPAGHKPELWLRLESLYNDKDIPASRTVTYNFRYDYRRAKLSTEVPCSEQGQ